MKSMIQALTLAGLLAFPAAGFAQTAAGEMVGMGHSMLTSQLVFVLNREGLPTDNIEKLTLSEIVQIQQILDDDSSQGNMRNDIQGILDEAATR